MSAAAAAAAAAAISSSYSSSTSSHNISDQYRHHQQLFSPNFGNSYYFGTTNQLSRVSRFPYNNGAAPRRFVPEARTVSTPATVESATVVDLDIEVLGREEVTLAGQDETIRCKKEESKVGRLRKGINRCVMMLRWKNVKKMRIMKVVGVKRQGCKELAESTTTAKMAG